MKYGDFQLPLLDSIDSLLPSRTLVRDAIGLKREYGQSSTHRHWPTGGVFLRSPTKRPSATTWGGKRLVPPLPCAYEEETTGDDEEM